MNIFVLDADIQRCAQYHCDQHVVKMILESAQILSTACHNLGLPAPYRPTHSRHPCTLWAQKSLSNFCWLIQLGFALNDEYHYRFPGKPDHKSLAVIDKLSGTRFEDAGLTPFAQAMPEVFKVPGDAVLAYRRFYIAEKLHFARWSLRTPPAWLHDADIMKAIAI